MDIRYIAYPTASEISLQNYFRDWKEFKNRATRLDILNPYFDCFCQQGGFSLVDRINCHEK